MHSPCARRSHDSFKYATAFNHIRRGPPGEAGLASVSVLNSTGGTGPLSVVIRQDTMSPGLLPNSDVAMAHRRTAAAAHLRATAASLHPAGLGGGATAARGAAHLEDRPRLSQPAAAPQHRRLSQAPPAAPPSGNGPYSAPILTEGTTIAASRSLRKHIRRRPGADLSRASARRHPALLADFAAGTNSRFPLARFRHRGSTPIGPTGAGSGRVGSGPNLGRA